MTTMPVSASPVGRRATGTRSKGDGARAAVTVAQIPPYCTGCGHDVPNHRSGRCWTGDLGEPVARAARLIACPCDRLVTA